MTGELSLIALEFARRCMGWEDAYSQEDGHIDVPSSDDGSSPAERFPYSDLNAVMEAVREWCKQNGLRWRLFSDDFDGAVYAQFSERSKHYETLATAVYQDPCQALLAAAVDAAKKLEAA